MNSAKKFIRALHSTRLTATPRGIRDTGFPHGGTDGSQTRRWREPDSNHRSAKEAVGAFANFAGAVYSA
jgi:hypothetical protein